MKNKLLLIAPLALLLLSGCSGVLPEPSSQAPQSSQAPSSEPIPGSSVTPSSQAPSSEPVPGSSITPSSEIPSSQAPSSQGSSTSMNPGTKVQFRFYRDYNHFEADEPLLAVWWVTNNTFTKEDLGLIPIEEEIQKATDIDPYYPVFAGWSKYALIDEPEHLLKFGEDVVTNDEVAGGYINFFGIYLSN